eukprot:4391228-Amphidinium_carterae.1
MSIAAGMFDALLQIPRKEGVLALWKGFPPYFLRSGGHTIFMFLFKDSRSCKHGVEAFCGVYRKFLSVIAAMFCANCQNNVLTPVSHRTLACSK